jgi:hypothetical protein
LRTEAESGFVDGFYRAHDCTRERCEYRVDRGTVLRVDNRQGARISFAADTPSYVPPTTTAPNLVTEDGGVVATSPASPQS